ncbi:sigma-B regulation protein RsbU (phosphoserine phosphatase) [Anaerovirgula multivorans]|uniref:Stage 0 sporulation protein A homolog n=1 Tax=Anaerovirgula multivorans TaxID=312168 RepID=A0A239AN48_9FIRM|nr:SpoIIE family protein phosphatase [Anaerovirgula multivorans]SNR96979.1 sigma-B regulation protein RsbU (phosphoserine phosphatase) [Anaerovirgula multivorans]
MTYNKILILIEEKQKDCYLKKVLRKYGHEVVEKHLEEDLINLVSKVMPHVILINITDNTYLKVIKTLKDNKDTNGIPILLFLDDEKEKEKSKAIDLGVNDFLQRPIDEKELVFKIHNQLKTVALEEDLKKTKSALEESLVTIKNQRIELEHNLTMASQIQEALIPKTLGNIPNCSFFWHFQPSGKVGGDIFDVFMLDEDHMGLYVIDVMGHGVASSMLAVALSEFLILDVDRGSPLKRKIDNPPYYEIIPPVEVIKYLNKRFPFTKYQHYFTIFYMVLNVKTGVLKYVRGAHPAPILVRNNGDFVELDGYGTPVGFEFTEGYEEKTIYLEPGDHLIIYTDGLLELKEDDGNTLEYEGFIKYLQEEIKSSNYHYLTYNINQLANRQQHLKDDLSVLEMKWVKFI